MSQFISFVSEQFLKSITPISTNVDMSELTCHLEITELLWTREITGLQLYDDLKTKFIAQTLSAEEITLVGYLKQHIAYRAASEALPFLNVKMVAKGPSKLRGEYSDPATLKDVQWLQSSLMNRAEYFEERCKAYLCNNSSLFPLYLVTDNELGIIANQESSWDSDIYLDTPPNLGYNRIVYGPNRNQ
jgi:hypothetical protein